MTEDDLLEHHGQAVLRAERQFLVERVVGFDLKVFPSEDRLERMAL